MDKKALVVGATGLVGKELLNILLDQGNYSTVVALTRKPLDIDHDRYQNVVTNFDNLDEVSDKLQADDVFCCLGTTMKKAGSKEKFRKVDYDYPLQIAQMAHKNGASQYLLVSALGADESSSVFYNQVKGEVEKAIAQVGFNTFHVFRPSLLMGKRNEDRVGEDAAKTIFNIFGFLFVGPLKKYKAIKYDKVSRAMAHMAQENKSGHYIYESLELQKY